MSTLHHNDTPHNLSGEATSVEVLACPNFRIEDAPHLWTKAQWEERISAARAVLQTKASGPDDPIVTGRGEMEPHWKFPLEKAQQKNDAYRPHIGTFRQLQAWIDSELAVGRKDLATYWVAGVSFTRGRNAEDAFVGAQILSFDLDGLLAGPEYWALFYRCLEELCGEGVAVNGGSTANHLRPGKGPRHRAALLLGFTIWDYEEYRWLSEYVAGHIRSAFGSRARGNAVDACAATAMQCMYTPRVPGSEDLSNYESRTFGTRSWGAEGEALLAKFREQKAAAKAKAEREQAEKEAIAARARAEGQITEEDATVAAGGIEAARRSLLALPIPQGAGRRNQLIPKAIARCRHHGLDRDQTLSLLGEIYGEWSDDPTWMERWVDCIFKKPHSSRGNPRKGVTRGLSSIIGGYDGIVSLDLGDSAPPDTEQKQGVTTFSLSYSSKLGDTNTPSGVVTPPVTTLAPTTCAPAGEVEKVVTPTVGDKPTLWDIWEPLGIPQPAKLVKVGRQWMPPLVGEGAVTEDAFVVFVDSGVATGKTTAMEAAAREFLDRGDRVLRVLPGQVLAEGQAETLGISSHRDVATRWDRDSISTTLHSLSKVELWTTHYGSGGSKELDLDDTLDTGSVVQTPISLLQIDEANEVLGALTSAPMRGLGRCDKVQAKLTQIIQDMYRRWLAGEKVQVHVACAHLEPAVLRWISHCLEWKAGEVRPFAYIHNPHVALDPGIRVRSNLRLQRALLVGDSLDGKRVFVACGTRRAVKVESRRYALAYFRARAGFDPKPWLAPHGKNILAPATELGALVQELTRRGLRLEDVRPRVLTGASDDFSPEVERFIKNPNAEAEKYDAIFLTPIAASGINLDQLPLKVFAFYQEGPGLPGAQTLLQAIFRARIQPDPIDVLITGGFEADTEEVVDWYARFSTVSATWRREVGGLCGFDFEKGADGVVHALAKGDDDYLLWRLAEARAKHERECHIADRLDAQGNVIEVGDFTAMARHWRLRVESQGLSERLNEDRTPEEIQQEFRADRELVKSLRDDADQALADETSIPLDEAKRRRKQGVRDTKAKRQAEKITLQHRHHLKVLTVEHVREARKHRDHWDLAAVWRAIQHLPGVDPLADARTVARKFIEQSRGVAVHQDKTILKAIYCDKWIRALFPAGIEDAVEQGTPLPSFGDWLAQPGHEEDREVFGQLFGFSVDDDEDLPSATTNLLRSLGLETFRRQGRCGKGKRTWIRRIKPESWALMNERTQPEVDRLLHPDEAKTKWDALELEILRGDPPAVIFALEEMLRESSIQSALPAQPAQPVGVGISP